MLEVEVGGDELAAHHEQGVDDLGGAGHPHLVAGHGLGGGDGRHGVTVEEGGEGASLVAVADGGGGGVGIDVTDAFERHAGVGHGHAKGAQGTVDVGHGDVVAVGREAVAEHLGEDRCATASGVLVALQDDGGGTATGHEPVAVAVEGTGGARRIALAGGEGADAVEAADGRGVDLLRAAADDALLQALPDEQCAESDGMRTAGAGAGDGEVDAAEAEDAGEVHRDGGVHRLEDGAGADERRVALLAEEVHAVDDGLGRAVVAVEDAHVVAVDVVGVEAGLTEGVAGGDVGVLGLFGHVGALAAAEFALEVGRVEPGGECRPEAELFALGVERDARPSLAEGLLDGVERGAQAGVDAQAGNDCSVHSSV